MSLKKQFVALFTPKNQRKTASLWLLINLLYDVARAFVVDSVFGEYGINGIVYLVFVLLFSVLFSFSTFKLVQALVQKNRGNALLYAPLSVAAFFAPDAYIFIVGRNLPRLAVVALIAYILISTAFAVRHTIKDVQSRKIN